MSVEIIVEKEAALNFISEILSVSVISREYVYGIKLNRRGVTND
ncbi:hypothetical protein KP77_04840 [Jeotgalibacillus alimentarius]|uniref:Uncharacterized protein n=1 Tax=Jeotgalibacillus alimentarius TaxID=135826 RepID=A0A0C2WBV5_9BACL|nr:hypothetical protein KP77_04840 [Jeotgalibacillus alimentarius]